MALAAAALLVQMTPLFRALPAAIPSFSASTARTAVAADVQFPDPSSHAATNSTLAPDLAAAYAAKSAASSTDSTLSATANPAPLHPEPNALALSGIRIQPIAPDSEHQVVQARTWPSRRSWLVLAIAQSGAAAFDAYSTRRAISQGRVELDPMMRPFAHSSGLYAAIQVSPLVLDFVSRKMQRSQNNFLRRMWWLPQAASTSGFLFSGIHNLNVAGHP